MKNLFYVLAAGFLLASCTTDTTCTCTFDEVGGIIIDPIIVECIGCDSDEAEVVAAYCEDSDLVDGVTCVLD